MAFIRDAWYGAGWESELGNGPLARRMLDEPVVIFRTEAGELGALRDVCPHRAVPLSLGSVEGDHLRCPYHGLDFDTQGICRRNPHVKGPPDRLRTRSYPVTERYGMLWVWFGDPALADPDLITDYTIFDESSHYKSVKDYIHVKADYRLIIDNLMDLAHGEYIHPETVGTPGASEVEEASVTRGDRGEGTVTVNTLWPDLPPNAVSKAAWTQTDTVDAWQEMTWHKPSHMYLNLGIMAPGAPRDQGLHTPSAHILTPETERTTHYFWAFARDFEHDNPYVSDGIRATVNRAFGTEDAPILEAAQERLADGDVKLVNFSVGDAGSAVVRREIERILQQEAAAREAPAMAAAE